MFPPILAFPLGFLWGLYSILFPFYNLSTFGNSS